MTENFIIQQLHILTEEWFETLDLSAKKNVLVIYDKKTRQFIKELSIPHPLGTIHSDQLYLLENLDPDNYTIGVYEFNM